MAILLQLPDEGKFGLFRNFRLDKADDILRNCVEPVLAAPHYPPFRHGPIDFWVAAMLFGPWLDQNQNTASQEIEASD